MARAERFDLSLVLTHACNLACPYCYMGEHHVTSMSEETAFKAIDLALERADDLFVSFFGGEPLLAWELLVHCAEHARAAVAARAKTLTMQVTTNGTLVTPARAAELERLGVAVAVSLDGTREAHEAGRPMRGGASSYDAALAGATALRDAGVDIDVIAVTTPKNVAYLAESVASIASLSPRKIVLNPSFGEAWDDAALASWEAGLTAVAELLLDRWRKGVPLYVNAFDGKLAGAARGVGAAHCSVGRWNVAVAPSGNLYPCDRLVGEDRSERFRAGHLSRGIELDRALSRGPADAECEPCAERDRCGGSCACANIAETGEPNLPGGTQCWYERTTARLADAIGWALLEEGNARFLERAYGARPEASAIARPRRLPIAP